jgi:hypothetical protein
VWRVDTPAVPRSLDRGGCGATAAAPLVDIFESTPEAGVCFAGPGVCGSGRVTGKAKVTLAGSWRVSSGSPFARRGLRYRGRSAGRPM